MADTIARIGKRTVYFDFELSDKQFQRRYTIDGMVHLNEKIMDINGRERIISKNTIGTPLNANILTLDEDIGELVECKSIYSDHLLYDYYHLGNAFFGGHLLNTRKGDRVMVVQEEVHAIMGAYLFPKDLWIAVGHGRELSEYLLSTIKATKIILYPDYMAFDYWERLAHSVDKTGKRLFPSIMISDVFVKTDIHEFLTYHIRQQNGSQEQKKMSILKLYSCMQSFISHIGSCRYVSPINRVDTFFNSNLTDEPGLVLWYLCIWGASIGFVSYKTTVLSERITISSWAL